MMAPEEPEEEEGKKMLDDERPAVIDGEVTTRNPAPRSNHIPILLEKPQGNGGVDDVEHSGEITFTSKSSTKATADVTISSPPADVSPLPASKMNMLSRRKEPTQPSPVTGLLTIASQGMEDQASTDGSTHRNSSLAMRQMPIDFLLQPAWLHSNNMHSPNDNQNVQKTQASSQRDTSSSFAYNPEQDSAPSLLSEGDFWPGGDEQGRDQHDDKGHLSITTGKSALKSVYPLRALCLRKGCTLRTQMLLSFGSISFSTVILVVVTCIVVAMLAGEEVKQTSQKALEEIARETQTLTARYMAESLSEKLLFADAIGLLREATMDRFSGYPNAGLEDTYVPFIDALTGTPRYPIDFTPPPLEWQFTSNVDSNNFEEHFQNQEYYRGRPASTASASFLFKGVCDPSETDATADAYWPNCTEANNDVTTGGVLQPTSTTEEIYLKSKDLIPLLKAMFESRENIRDVGLYFANNGAGATLNYPHLPLSTQSIYTSNGCDWMSEPNFYDPSRPIGTPDMIERCAPAETIVSSRAYSPLERSWCALQALQPDRVHFFASEDAWEQTTKWVLVSGRSVYDRITNEFIACTLVTVSMEDIDSELKRLHVVEGDVISIVKWDEEGLLVGSSIAYARNSGGQGSVPIHEAEIGVTEEVYRDLYRLVDFETEWDPYSVRSTFLSFNVESRDYFVSVYPIPPIPETYDPSYEPLFMVIVSTPLEELRNVVEQASEIVDEQVRAVGIFSIFTGAAGLGMAFLIISFMASVLTRPLHNMSKVANGILSTFGDSSRGRDAQILAVGKMEASKGGISCTPRTELADVVEEFNKMVATFSGPSMARTERHKHLEFYNMFKLKQSFESLYQSRSEDHFPFALEPPFTRNWTNGEPNEVAIDYIHAGSNTITDHCSISSAPGNASDDNKSGTSSPLFTWIVASIVTPLIIVNIIISAVALSSVSTKFGVGVEEAEKFFLDIERAKYGVHSRLRADYVQSMTMRTTGDLHILTRYMGWLIMGGISPAPSNSALYNGMEECKNYTNPADCPYVKENHICDCEWQDPVSEQCEVFSTSTRDRQRSWWFCELDSNNENGDRFSTSFPDTAYSKASTQWWDDQLTVPGYNTSASFEAGHETMYQRLRAAAAVPLMESIYNNFDDPIERTLGTYVGFEADGLFVGYSGCRMINFAGVSSFRSSIENGAAILRPELCPVDKFGFDPRCRGWYDEGRNLAMHNNTFLHITAPYLFATIKDSLIAQSATSPIIDTSTGEHLGQILYDFSPTKMIRTLREDTIVTEAGFPILVATQTAVNDSVIAPNFELADPPAPIAAKVLQYDFNCTTPRCLSNLESFQAIVKDLKAGGTNNIEFQRSSVEGEQETVIVAYAPVTVRSLKAIDGSDFSRGIEVSDYLIYSLGLAAPQSELLKTFNPIGNEIEGRVRVSIGVLSAVLIAAIVLVVGLSLGVSRSIAQPMVYLLDAIRSIRKKGETFEFEMPDLRLEYASKEIIEFSDSIEMLSKVVRSANAAFHAGEFEVAYYVLRDALRLFRRLENEKAVGVACNNLGNVLLAMYHAMLFNNVDNLGGLTKEQIIRKGIAYFHEAIQLGEKAYNEFYNLHGWTPICLDFMQHLSNRYFNRAMFLLSVKNFHDKPRELEELGKRDIQISCDMDAEIMSYAEDIGWNSEDRIENIFEIKIVRLGGYNLLLSLGYEDVWSMRELFKECLEFVTFEKRRPFSGLFQRIAYPGRLQEIETETMKYLQATSDKETAAKVAVRCLFEDEKVFADTLSKAVSALEKYFVSSPGMMDFNKVKVLDELHDYLDDIEGNVYCQTLASSGNSHREPDDIVDKVKASIVSHAGRESKPFCSKSWSLDLSSGRFVTMEDF